MTLQLQDQSSVDLTATIDDDHLSLTFEEPLSYDGNSIFHTLDELTQAELTIGDFSHGGQDYAVHAWEIVSEDGALSEPWSRSGGRVRSGPRASMNARVLLIAAPEGLVPEPETAEAPPPPTTSTTVLTVKVRKKGAMPGD
jgi:hypothetical protein